MANLACKNGIYVARFRFRKTEYKRSLKTRDRADAQEGLRIVEQTIHRLLVGLLEIPEGVDPGDFIVSGGSLKSHPEPVRQSDIPSTRTLVAGYLDSQQDLCADTYLRTQRVHLNHLLAFLGKRADQPGSRVTRIDLEKLLRYRLKRRETATVAKERVTLGLFYNWAFSRPPLDRFPSPTNELLTIDKSEVDLPEFRTIEEIEKTIARGGLTEDQIRDEWGRLYLNPEEIADLLATVRRNSCEPLSFMLHVIPAYTGMRRSEVLRLQWSDIDFDYGYVTARSLKQSRKKKETRRKIDIHPELRDYLLAWREQRPKGQYVLCEQANLAPLGKDRANRLFWQPMRRTEWCLNSKKNWFKIGFHTYRHSFASNLAAAGVDQRIIDAFMGHQTQAMRERYRHLFPQKRRSAIECFSLANKESREDDRTASVADGSPGGGHTADTREHDSNSGLRRIA